MQLSLCSPDSCHNVVFCLPGNVSSTKFIPTNESIGIFEKVYNKFFKSVFILHYFELLIYFLTSLRVSNTHTCTCAHRTCTCAHAHAHMHTHMHTCTCTHHTPHTHPIHTCAHTIHTHVHTHTHTCTNTHTHILCSHAHAHAQTPHTNWMTSIYVHVIICNL